MVDYGARVVDDRIPVQQPNPGIGLGESQRSFVVGRRVVVEVSITQPH